MTPRQKAIELVRKYTIITEDKLYDYKYSKQCSIIAVNFAIEIDDINIDYLYEVKQEIEKL